MIVCVCNQMDTEKLKELVECAPVAPYEPFDLNYKTTESQVCEYVESQLQRKSRCPECSLFIRECVRHILLDDNKSNERGGKLYRRS